MAQVVQVAGSLAVLAGFVLASRGVLDVRSGRYLGLNLAGSAVLTGSALAGRQWGFLLLNATWAVVSLVGLVREVRGRRAGAAPDERP